MTAENRTPAAKSPDRAAMSNLTVQIVGGTIAGLLVAAVLALVTGFVNLTFSTKSWERFRVSNAPGTPGSYLAPDAVYLIPVNERFSIDGNFLLSVGRTSSGFPIASIVSADGQGRSNRINTTSSVTAADKCTAVAVHLMRYPERTDMEFFVMYTSQRSDNEACKGFWGHLFG